jgi:hypothetical protein
MPPHQAPKEWIAKLGEATLALWPDFIREGPPNPERTAAMGGAGIRQPPFGRVLCVTSGHFSTG